MAASLQGVPMGSLVHRFITSGKPGKCELCPAVVDKLEAHHVCYNPEKTIKLCHICHHKVHFWPLRLSKEEKLKLLKKIMPEKSAQMLAEDEFLGIQALAKLIAPSRNAFVHASQKLEVKRIERSESDRKQLKAVERADRISQKRLALHHHKLFKDKPLKGIQGVVLPNIP